MPCGACVAIPECAKGTTSPCALASLFGIPHPRRLGDSRRSRSPAAQLRPAVLHLRRRRPADARGRHDDEFEPEPRVCHPPLRRPSQVPVGLRYRGVPCRCTCTGSRYHGSGGHYLRRVLLHGPLFDEGDAIYDPLEGTNDAPDGTADDAPADSSCRSGGIGYTCDGDGDVLKSYVYLGGLHGRPMTVTAELAAQMTFKVCTATTEAVVGAGGPGSTKW